MGKHSAMGLEQKSRLPMSVLSPREMLRAEAGSVRSSVGYRKPGQEPHTGKLGHPMTFACSKAGNKAPARWICGLQWTLWEP